ncbi:MAG: hypothetical protein ACK559_24155, partial [bacterium]
MGAHILCRARLQPHLPHHELGGLRQRWTQEQRQRHQEHHQAAPQGPHGPPPASGSGPARGKTPCLGTDHRRSPLPP